MTDEHYLYPIGLDVHLGTGTSPVYRIVDRHIRKRDLFGDYPEYLLEAEDGTHTWEGEPDICPLDEEET